MEHATCLLLELILLALSRVACFCLLLVGWHIWDGTNTEVEFTTIQKRQLKQPGAMGPSRSKTARPHGMQARLKEG